MSAWLGVSRMTLRHALLDLTAAGTLYTRTGKGTYVAERKIEQPLLRLSGFTQDMVARGMRPASRVLSKSLLPAPFELAQTLGIEPGSEIVELRRLRLADDHPVAIESAHLSHAVCPGLLDRDLSDVSLYDVLRSLYGITLGSARQTIEASQPVAEERLLLELPARVPVLRIHRLTSDSTGRVIEFVRAVYRGDRYQLNVELR